MSRKIVPKPEGYDELLGALVERIRRAQLRAAVAVGRELVELYWQIGREILKRQGREGWGAKVIDRLATDLRRAFPGARGFSARNLRYMKALAQEWPEGAIVQQVLHKLPWGHLVRLLDKVKDRRARDWYLRAAVECGWSRSTLVHQIQTRLFERQGKAVTNFGRTLSAPRSELVEQVLKDLYRLDFLMLGEDARELDIERGLVRHLRDFLLELGVGFAFVGNQVALEVGRQEYWIDLLFYHLKLRCYVVIELKSGEFKPEYAGKLNFYLSAVNELLRHPDDQPSIGLILCRGKDRVVAEYAIRDLAKPIGISECELSASLPQDLKGRLPSIEDLEAELRGMPEEPTGS